MFKDLGGWQRMFLSGCLVLLAFVAFGDLFAQDGNLKNTLTGFNTGIFAVIKGVAYVLAFGTGIWQFMEGWSQQQLSSKWLTFIGIAIFLAVLAKSDDIFNMLRGGGNKSDFINEGDDKLKIWTDK